MADAAVMRERARQVAEDVLLPAALAVDRADRVPAGHLDLLAAQGFYGVAAPVEAGGLGVADLGTAAAIIETLASGCLATAFVYLQHHGPLIATAFSDRPGITQRFLGPLSRGERRAGIALSGLRPGAAGLRVRELPDTYELDGEVTWVTGWDMIDTLHVAVRGADNVIRYLLADAVTGPTLRAEPLELVAAAASRTVHLRFDRHPVPADRLTGLVDYDEWLAGDAGGSVLNGFLALGVAARCAALLGPGPLDDELAACRAALLGADAAGTPAARAAASELALRAATILLVRTGARAVLRAEHAQRLLREAAFLQVFGSRPAIRSQLLARYGATDR
jgi:alkylation response protein AidB-like acyl-CoA dehydrogenase